MSKPDPLRWALKRIRAQGVYDDHDQERLAELAAMATGQPIEASAVAWVPRCHSDSILTIVGQFAWEDLREYPFEVSDPEIWECVALYLGDHK